MLHSASCRALTQAVIAADLRRADAPLFEDFRVEPVSEGRPAAVNLKSHPLARRYMTVLRAGAQKGPNFAGHYTVVGWGCGSSCIRLAVIDTRNGAVFVPEAFDSVSGVRVNSLGFEPAGARDGYWGLRYRVDSRLLIVLGALDGSADREGATYLSFERGAFRQVATTYVKKRPCGSNTDSSGPSDKRLDPGAAGRNPGNQNVSVGRRG